MVQTFQSNQLGLGRVCDHSPQQVNNTHQTAQTVEPVCNSASTTENLLYIIRPSDPSCSPVIIIHPRHARAHFRRSLAPRHHQPSLPQAAAAAAAAAARRFKRERLLTCGNCIYCCQTNTTDELQQSFTHWPAHEGVCRRRHCFPIRLRLLSQKCCCWRYLLQHHSRCSLPRRCCQDPHPARQYRCC